MKHKAPAKIPLVGSGNWDTTIAGKHNNDFDPEVRMLIHEEIVNGKKLPEIINTQHENIKGHLKKGALAISFIKGFLVDKKENVIRLVSERIRELLSIDTAVLMGANMAEELEIMNSLRQRLAIEVKKKVAVACATDFADGLGYGSNTRETIIRLDCICRAISSRIKYSNILRKLRITDFTAICNSGRNRKICEAFVKTKKSIQDLEREMLDGQSIQGPATAEAIFMMLKKHNLISRFPVHHCGTSNM
ncbi:unnamed protein product [Brugia pahangi]|uniref:Glycerol-3-phosphate dehydrogenase [NAD(+)] n=1 Tax=Brugia pahangi TaxID=6280 RepID=A0A158PR77_BRUPA|nr:unnamed protein product [Brugia pahangi]